MKATFIAIAVTVCSLSFGRVCMAGEYLSGYANVLQSAMVPLTDDERREHGVWAQSFVEKHPAELTDFRGFIESVAIPLTSEERKSIFEWYKRMISKEPQLMVHFADALGFVETSTMSQEECESNISWAKGVVDGCPEALLGMCVILAEFSGSASDSFLQGVATWIYSPVHVKANGMRDCTAVFLEISDRATDATIETVSASAMSLAKQYPTWENVDSLMDLYVQLGRPMADQDRRDLAKAVRDGLDALPEETCGGWSDGSYKISTTNVVVNYVLNSVVPELVVPPSTDTGFVNIIAEVKGGCVAVPLSWAEAFPDFTKMYGSEFVPALASKTGKRDGAGNEMLVWQDYVAGTDPTDSNDVFRASVTMKEGKPLISWSPELKPEEAALRKYTVWGKAKLSDAKWSEVPEGSEGDYNFFKVSVEMR